ncbi:DUF5856 family protein [Bacteroidales bacterium OttesenSCG-928-I21]|nr:DUF5856 family protein [Bacteroidales bacterium OttesenSCG-928-I21]
METKKKVSNAQVAEFIGSLYSFNNSLKLYHWHVTGPSSYAQHIALDQAIEDLSGTLDSIAETSYALLGDLAIIIPETQSPKNIVKHVNDFYKKIDEGRELFTENFTEGLLDDYQEALVQLLYRLNRLS